LKLKPIGNHSPVISGKSVILFFKPKNHLPHRKTLTILPQPELRPSSFFGPSRGFERFGWLSMEGDPVEFGLFGRVSEKKASMMTAKGHQLQCLLAT
jgi:hypothetical protein